MMEWAKRLQASACPEPHTLCVIAFPRGEQSTHDHSGQWGPDQRRLPTALVLLQKKKKKIQNLFPGVSGVFVRELHHPAKLADDHSRLKHLGEAFVARAAVSVQSEPPAQGGSQREALQVSRERTEYREPPARRHKHGIIGHAIGGPPGLGGMVNTNFLGLESRHELLMDDPSEDFGWLDELDNLVDLIPALV